MLTELLLGHCEEIKASDFIFPHTFDILFLEEPLLLVQFKEIQYNQWAPTPGAANSAIWDIDGVYVGAVQPILLGVYVGLVQLVLLDVDVGLVQFVFLEVDVGLVQLVLLAAGLPLGLPGFRLSGRRHTDNGVILGRWSAVTVVRSGTL
jgi:hypothetical protein